MPDTPEVDFMAAERARIRWTNLRSKRGVKLERKKNCRIKTKSYGAAARPVPKRVESATWTRSILFLSLSFFFRFNFTPAPIFGLFASAGGHRRRFIMSREKAGQIAENPFSKKIEAAAIYTSSSTNARNQNEMWSHLIVIKWNIEYSVIRSQMLLWPILSYQVHFDN